MRHVGVEPWRRWRVRRLVVVQAPEQRGMDACHGLELRGGVARSSMGNSQAPTRLLCESQAELMTALKHLGLNCIVVNLQE